MSTFPDSSEFIYVVNVVTNQEKGITLKSILNWFEKHNYVKKIDFRHVGSKTRWSYDSKVTTGSVTASDPVKFNRFRFRDNSVATHFKLTFESLTLT